jgi:hypothetical protein
MEGAEMSMRAYQELPALSASGAFELSETCPALYWAWSPFNPERIPRENKREFDIGTAAHLAILEAEEYDERVSHLPFDDFRTKEARDIRDRAAQFDRIVLKPSEVKIVDGIRAAIERRPDVLRLFRGGVAEKTIVWGDNPPRKCRPDYLVGCDIIDLKTVNSAHPKAISRAAAREGWHVRVPWYREGVDEVRGPNITGWPRPYRFVCVEKTEPYLIEVYELSPRAIAWGEQIIRRSLRLWRQCNTLKVWHGYEGGVIDLPTGEEYGLADREAAGEFRGDDE